ncbi:MAG: heat-inducible transcription repressor HrcA [Christensenellaceae bacterium]|nr:heat-inducible transcription repressor HrcA [Christensenellaceae bacterium]
MALTDRKLLILQAIIDDYILTGIPVGSRTLSKREDIRFSSATIRNEMADLEEEGYLEQPHTSAGRLPSDKAYRLYVDTLMRTSRLSENEIRYIRGYFSDKMGEIESAINNTAKVLSDITNLTSVVMTPQISKVKLNRIQLVKLSGHRALLVIVFNTGHLKDVMIHVPEDMDSSYLDMISNMISERVRGLTLPQAMNEINKIMNGDLAIHREFIDNILTAVRSKSVEQTGKQIILGGTQNIFNHPEYRDVEKARNFLKLIETKEPLYNMLSQSTDMEFTIRIGKENEIDELKDMSVITATYRVGDTNLGSFGVIGPTRMNYAKVLSVMNLVGASINELLSCFVSINDKEEG